MATVYLGRLLGPVGFSRPVAIKRLHPTIARDPELVAMLIDEARLAARIRHPNVVPVLDVVEADGEICLVMEYVHGASLASILGVLADVNGRVPVAIAAAIAAGVLHGLHAAHEATDEHGRSLGLVHRDVSPQNILLGADGVPRVIDFGVAKAARRLQHTRTGQIKGKLGYMAPEQLAGARVSRAADIYAAGVVLWEVLTGRRLTEARHADADRVLSLITKRRDPPSRYVEGLDEEVDGIVLRALELDPSRRFPTAREMALALEAATDAAPPSAIGEWVEWIAAGLLSKSGERLRAVEQWSAATEPEAVASASRPSRLRSVVVVALAVGAAGAAVFAWKARGTGDRPAPSAASAPLVTATLAAPDPTTPTEQSTGSVLAPVVSAPAANPASRAMRPRAPSSPRAPARNARECEPPYEIDASSGLKRYKPECF
jgi:serine/threonine-protein kinase